MVHNHTTSCTTYQRIISSVTCASVHRKIGVHVSKVSVYFDAYTYVHFTDRSGQSRKSLTLDSWSKEQVEVCLLLLRWSIVDLAQSIKNIGNVKSNQLYNPDERKHPPPSNFESSDRGSELEVYIRVCKLHRPC